MSHSEWEYKVIEIESVSGGILSNPNPNARLTRLGREGWELVDTVEQNGSTKYLIFKKPLGADYGEDVIMVPCPNCQETIADKREICPHCGVEVYD